MTKISSTFFFIPLILLAVFWGAPGNPNTDALLTAGLKAVWDLDKAYRERSPTRERVCINGLWRWQPAGEVKDAAPKGRWGYFKVPGSWPGFRNYMHKDSQVLYSHPEWKDENLGHITAAWYQREISIPVDWAGRRIVVSSEYLNSHALVYIDDKRAGEIRFPAGEVDLTALCRPGEKYLLSLLVTALPLKAVMLSYSDTNTATEVKGTVARKGLCGDVYLSSAPRGERIVDTGIDTSVQKWEITINAGLEGLVPGRDYTLKAGITENGRIVKQFASRPFHSGDLKDGRFVFSEKWRPGNLWDLHTPKNTFEVELSLLETGGNLLDASHPVRFGFREFRIEGRDFYLNGSRIFLSSVPLDNAQSGAVLANYEAAKETLLRLKSFGINFVFTHNYNCQPGSHISFAEILRAADDTGMLVSFSQPHFRDYEWHTPDADRINGYARHAEFYVRTARNHPSVVMYSMSHNTTGYSEDMNPDMIDGIQEKRSPAGLKNVERALRAEAIVRSLDQGRIIYHHSSGNLGSMHTSNFYPNFVPVQEQSDWFEHWATKGVKPLFTCEYATPMTWDWTMYRGWYQGKRAFGGAQVPWEFCLAEWNSQFLGDRAFRISEYEKKNLRWEAKQFRDGKVWKRWDYPFHLDSMELEERFPVFAMYLTDNWRAFRTWGVSAISPGEYSLFWKLREGVDRGRKEFKVDWENLQRPGFSPDYIEGRYERIEMAFDRTDWAPTVAAGALIRNNMPLLAYIGGKASRFTSKDHNFFPGETVEKQVIIINNSRETVSAECRWAIGLPEPVAGTTQVRVKTGDQERIPIRFDLPASVAPGQYQINLRVRFGSGQTQEDSFSIHVLPGKVSPKPAGKIALFDPKGETGQLLKSMGVTYQPVDANVDLSAYDLFIVGKGALTADGRAPDISHVRKGLKVIIFEQTSEVLEKRFGFRVQEYGLRQVFKRVPDHPALAGLGTDHLRDWRGAATILPPRLKYDSSPRFGGDPAIRWCDIEVTRAWRCGNLGNVASVLIEKPGIGDFLPIADGGFSLQYSPLMEYREGKGMVLFCQVDVTGRTESDPAAERLASNILEYVSSWKPPQWRKPLYAGDGSGKRFLKEAGLSPGSYEGGSIAADQVLIAGPGSGKKLGKHAAEVEAWLKVGGNLLAIGLDEEEANAFLPAKVRMKKEEHIAAFFEPFGMVSPFSGVAPADVHNRDPREMSLVYGGAAIFGNGILARAENANVVFCQLAPWQFDDKRQNTKRTYRRASFLIARLLGNMGVSGSAPVLSRFNTPVVAKTEKRFLAGLYLDTPEEWDDPYRFFRW